MGKNQVPRNKIPNEQALFASTPDSKFGRLSYTSICVVKGIRVGLGNLESSDTRHPLPVVAIRATPQKSESFDPLLTRLIFRVQNIFVASFREGGFYSDWKQECMTDTLLQRLSTNNITFVAAKDNGLPQEFNSIQNSFHRYDPSTPDPCHCDPDHSEKYSWPGQY